MKRTRAEDRHLLGNECNFIVNLSLSESKQWYDLCTICPSNLSLLLLLLPPSSSSSFSITLLLVLRSHLPFLPPSPSTRPWRGSNRTRFRKEGCGCDTWTRRLAPRYRDIASIASVTARRYVKEGYLSLSLSRAHARLSRSPTGIWAAPVHSFDPFVRRLHHVLFFFFFSIFRSLESKDFFSFSSSFFLEGSRGNLVGFSMIMDLSCSKREA